MDLQLTDDQKLFQETTARFIQNRSPITVVRQLHDDPSGFSRDWLRQAADLGWFAMLVPEEQGGGSVSGAGLVDATIVADQLGRYAQPGPFVPMNVVASALARHGSPEQHGDHLTAIVAGERVATWAPLDANGEWDRGSGLTATPAGTGHRLSGVRGYVQDGQTAELILASASIDGGIAQFLVPTAAEGVTVTPLVSFDLSRRFAEISFDDAPAELLGPVDTSGVSDALDHQLQIALALLNAETAGALDAMFGMTVAYAKDRTAFGRPIGSFQALKHILADVALRARPSSPARCRRSERMRWRSRTSCRRSSATSPPTSPRSACRSTVASATHGSTISTC
jgi:alkylation response protein AidB-like acyl-CoA dehydrogenase